MKIFQRFDYLLNDFYNEENKKKSIRLIFWLSILFNTLFFAAAIAHNPPAWYTNDDFRMMTIVSGVYTGTPSPDIVFMRYPIGLLLSSLYRLTTAVPWYGIFTMLCMYIPSCIFCYLIVKKAYEKEFTLFGVLMYVLLFVFFIQKYVCLPQFTLTSAFMGVGAMALLYEMPEKKNGKYIILAVICTALSFSIRSKAFYLLLPALILIVAVRIFKDKQKCKQYIIWGASALVLCLAVLGVDNAMWSQPDYAEFKEFKEARSELYDYYSVANYYDNITFYTSNGISEVTYHAISGRFLDLDETVNTENLEKIAQYQKENENQSISFTDKLSEAFKNGLSRWYYLSDKTVKYCAIFVTVLLFLCVALSIKRRRIEVVFPALTAGMLLETVFLEFNGRIMVRLIDLMLLAMSVIGCLAVIQLLGKRKAGFADFAKWIKQNAIRTLSFAIAVCSVALFVASGMCNMQDDLDNKSLSLREATNSRLEALMKYTEEYPDAFFFYDAYDFIACSDYVFKTYDEGEVLNNESLGSWNSHSPSYYERNNLYGFNTAIEGLTSTDSEVYFLSISSPKMGVTKTLKDLYNKELVEVDRIQSSRDVVYVYMVVDNE